MANLTFLVLCVLSCLVQNAYQCSGPKFRHTMKPSFPVPNYAPARVPAYAPACSSGIAAPAVLAPAAYGGEGMGDISVAGRMPVAGTTAVAGQVPILGSVRFGGNVPARGTVTITGGSCGCNGRFF